MQTIIDWIHKHFEIKNVSWVKVGSVLGSFSLAWVFLQGTVPEPWHDRLQGIISFLAVFITTLLKAAKSGEPIVPTQPGGQP